RCSAAGDFCARSGCRIHLHSRKRPHGCQGAPPIPRLTRSRCDLERSWVRAASLIPVLRYNPGMPKKVPFLLAPLLVVLVSAVAAAAAATMRLDYYHTGTATQEVFSVDRVVIEPAPWPGNPQKTVDETNLGKYLFEVRDRATNRLLYSRGFASIFGEWE